MADNMICMDCGFVGEPESSTEHGTGYSWEYCPQCGGDMQDAYKCVDCGEYFAFDADTKIFCFLEKKCYCEDCLKSAFDFDLGYRYLKETDLTDAFVDSFFDDEDPAILKTAFADWLQHSDKYAEKNNAMLTAMIWEFAEGDLSHLAWWMMMQRRG